MRTSSNNIARKLLIASAALAAALAIPAAEAAARGTSVKHERTGAATTASILFWRACGTGCGGRVRRRARGA